jgi:hypothetical protein
VYVRNPSEYQLSIEDHVGDLQTRLSVRVPVTQRLFDQIGSLSSHKVASRESDEFYFQFGRARERLTDYTYVGWHGSDSGLTCVVREDPFRDDEGATPVDTTEFVLSTLQDPETESNPEEFPLYLWYAPIPEAASSARVYACDPDEDGNFEGLLIRSGEDSLTDNE